MVEPAISLARHAREVGLGDGIADERTDDFHSHFGIGPAGKTSDRICIEARPGRGHVKSAVAGKPREHRVDKTERRGLAPGGDVTHVGSVRG